MGGNQIGMLPAILTIAIGVAFLFALAAGLDGDAP